MGTQSTSGKSTTRRYTPEEKAQAVGRVAGQLGYGVESVDGVAALRGSSVDIDPASVSGHSHRA